MITDMLKLIAPGTPIRHGLENILKAKTGGLIVIGDSNIRKEKVESSKIITEIAQNCGYKLELEFSYIIQNPYINIPRNGKGGKIAMDNIIVLKKVVD